MKALLTLILIIFVIQSKAIVPVAGWQGIFLLPNAISKNNDGRNDCFKILNLDKLGGSISIKSFKLEIYNRWGQRVFSTPDPSFKWYAQEQQIGAYTYVIKLADANNVTKIITGTLNVL